MIACGSEGDNGMASNVAGSTGNENNFFCVFRTIFFHTINLKLRFIIHSYDNE